MSRIITPMELGILPENALIEVVRNGEEKQYRIKKHPVGKYQEKWMLDDDKGKASETFEIITGPLPEITVLD